MTLKICEKVHIANCLSSDELNMDRRKFTVSYLYRSVYSVEALMLTTISFKTDQPMLVTLQELAAKSQRTVSSLIREAVEFWLTHSPIVSHIRSTPVSADSAAVIPIDQPEAA